MRTETVTFLFTDVEGSTRLLRRLRDRYGEVLAEHERLLRAAFAHHGGREIDTQGDSFFVAFASARDAVLAAVDAQRALGAHGWPEGEPLRVRIGIHAGRATVRDNRYLGVAVHRAARIAAAGHGGQILLSETTRNLLEDEEEDLQGVDLRDLGEQQLKDFDRPVHVYQVEAEGLEHAFAPLRTNQPTPERGTTPFAPEAAPPRRLRVEPRLAAIAGVVIVLAAVPLAWIVFGGDSSQPALEHARPDSVAVIDPDTNRLIDAVPVGARPWTVVVGPSGVWVANTEDRTVSRIDPGARRVLHTTAVAGAEPAVAVTGNGVWVATLQRQGLGDVVPVSRIEPEHYTVERVQEVTAGGRTALAAPPSVAADSDGVWFSAAGTVVRLDPTSRRIVGRIETGVVVDDIALGEGAAWTTTKATGEGAVSGPLNKINPETNAVSGTAPVGEGASVATGFDAVWVASGARDTVTRFDPETLTSRASIQLPVGSFPTDIALGEDAVWVVNRISASVMRIDPETNTIVATIPIGGHPEGIAVGAGAVWVTVQE
jgi:YVTN family beta-propeller protein